ncbi:MAG: hypothetical protein Q8K36_01810, partial [Alphaproteobacteria bacterium]|nr:hypothetical protein [Alphaproteobacteria bacterium]
LIFDESYAPVTGHVSVVCAVGAQQVFVAEQNHSNAQWKGPDYSQSYPLSTLPSDTAENKLMYKILEKGLLGWIRF